MAMSPDAAPRMIESIIPILTVRDISTSIGYYETVLSFTVDWSTGGFVGLSRDGGSLCRRRRNLPMHSAFLPWELRMRLLAAGPPFTQR